jgi:hypothetical protein
LAGSSADTWVVWLCRWERLHAHVGIGVGRSVDGKSSQGSRPVPSGNWLR